MPNVSAETWRTELALRGCQQRLQELYETQGPEIACLQREIEELDPTITDAAERVDFLTEKIGQDGPNATGLHGIVAARTRIHGEYQGMEGRTERELRNAQSALTGAQRQLDDAIRQLQDAEAELTARTDERSRKRDELRTIQGPYDAEVTQLTEQAEKLRQELGAASSATRSVPAVGALPVDDLGAPWSGPQAAIWTGPEAAIGSGPQVTIGPRMRPGPSGGRDGSGGPGGATRVAPTRSAPTRPPRGTKAVRRPRRPRRPRWIVIGCIVLIVVIVIGVIRLSGFGRATWPANWTQTQKLATTACENGNVAATPNNASPVCSTEMSPVLEVYSLLTTGLSGSYQNAKTGGMGLMGLPVANGDQISIEMGGPSVYNWTSNLTELELAARFINNGAVGADINEKGLPQTAQGLEANATQCLRYTGFGGPTAVKVRKGYPNMCTHPLTEQGAALLAEDIWAKYWVPATGAKAPAQWVYVLMMNASNPGAPAVQQILGQLTKQGLLPSGS